MGVQTTIRLNFSQEALESLEKLKRLANLSTNAALIRNALAIYAWVLETQGNGEEILVRTKDGVVELVNFYNMPN